MAREQPTPATRATRLDLEPMDIAVALSGISFPTSKQTLVLQAVEVDASEQVLKALRKIPLRDYTDPLDVAAAYQEFHGREGRSGKP